MRRPRLLTALVVALLTGLSLVPGAAAEGGLLLREAGDARFPDRSYALTLPMDMFLDESRVEVRENGERVSSFSVIPAASAEVGQFGVVPVIDSTLTMRGPAIEHALAAARAFAERRNETQQLAVVTFNSKSTVLLPFTTSQPAIDEALESTPQLACCTPIYDAVDTAISLAENAGISSSSVIVLSDGADTGSLASHEQVTARARKAHVRIFSVGLRSPVFRPALLEQLAQDAGGDYSEAASPGDLEPIFDQLGELLANEYLLRYRSQAPPRSNVQVAVTVEGVEGYGEAAYTTPALATEPAGPFHRTFAERFLRSPGGMIVVTGAAALLLMLGFALVLRPTARTLRRRMAEFVSLAVPESSEESERRKTVLARAEKSFERTRWWARFQEELALAGIETPALTIVLAAAAGTLLATWILFSVGGLLIAPAGLAVPFLVRGLIRRKLERKRNLFADQLPDNLQVLASALRAGHSMVGALSVVVDDCPEPSRNEFRRVIADEQLGVPLDQALMVVAERMQSRDLEQVALVAALQRETGGNTAEVLDSVAETVRGRFELRRLVRTLTTQGRMSRWIVSLLPIALLILISSINPSYISPLFTHPAGRAALVLGAVMLVTGSLVIKKIVNIKV